MESASQGIFVPYSFFARAIWASRSSSDTGPITPDVESCALMLEVIAGRDGDLDPRQTGEIKTAEYTKALTGELARQQDKTLTTTAERTPTSATAWLCSRNCVKFSS